MLKTDLVALIAKEHPKLKVADAQRIVAHFFDIIAAQLARGGRVELRNFGVFEARRRVARIGRNPRTGESVALPDGYMTHFRGSRKLHLPIDAGLEPSSLDASE